MHTVIGMPTDVNERYPREYCGDCKGETLHEIAMKITETRTEKPRKEKSEVRSVALPSDHLSDLRY